MKYKIKILHLLEQNLKINDNYCCRYFKHNFVQTIQRGANLKSLHSSFLQNTTRITCLEPIPNQALSLLTICKLLSPNDLSNFKEI
jgi:hypothetical protein